MTLTNSVGSLHKERVRKGASAFFNNLGIYRFCFIVAVIDCLDITDSLDFTESNIVLVKYFYAAIVIVLFGIYFLRWKQIDTTNPAPVILLLLFLVTGLAFAIRFFIYDERQSYVSAFIGSLTFAAAIFIPRNAIMIDERRILKGLTYLFVLATGCYLLEAIVKPLDFFRSFSHLGEVQFVKSLGCVLALCLFILTGRNVLALLTTAVIVVALLLRPTSTFALALIVCVSMAVILRSRVLYFRPLHVAGARALAMTALLVAVCLPVVLYFYLDDLGPFIQYWEGYLKGDVLGGESNTYFRLAILRVAFETIRNTSFWFGSALTGSVTVPLSHQEGFQWWYFANGQRNGEAPIHSDFAVTFVLMGIIGLFTLAAAYYFALRTLFWGLGRRSLRGNGVVIHALSIIALVGMFIYSSDEAYLSCYSHANIVWMLLLISEMVRKSSAKVIERQQNSGIVRANVKKAGVVST